MIEITKNNAKHLSYCDIAKIESTNLTAEVGQNEVLKIEFFEVHGEKVLFFVYNTERSLTTYGAETWTVTTM